MVDEVAPCVQNSGSGRLIEVGRAAGARPAAARRGRAGGGGAGASPTRWCWNKRSQKQRNRAAKRAARTEERIDDIGAERRGKGAPAVGYGIRTRLRSPRLMTRPDTSQYLPAPPKTVPPRAVRRQTQRQPRPRRRTRTTPRGVCALGRWRSASTWSGVAHADEPLRVDHEARYRAFVGARAATGAMGATSPRTSRRAGGSTRSSILAGARSVGLRGPAATAAPTAAQERDPPLARTGRSLRARAGLRLPPQEAAAASPTSCDALGPGVASAGALATSRPSSSGPWAARRGARLRRQERPA